MKKWIVIATMALSMAAFTACGSKNDTAEDNTGITDEQKEETNTDAQEEKEDADTDATAEGEEDGTQAEEEGDSEDTDASAEDAGEEGAEDAEKDENSEGDEEEDLIETGEKPDFKVNKNGCFNGTYEGNDGCIYKFTKKGILTVTSDSETMKYEYSLNEDILNMVATDGSMGKVLQITLLEDGTYLLDNAMGTQVILTYVE